MVTLSREACGWLCRTGVAAVCLLASCTASSAAHTCRAEGSSALVLGILAPVAVEMRVRVPHDGLWRAPQSTFVCSDTLLVMDAKRKPLPRATGDPQQGQFSWRPGGIVQLSPEDAGRKLVVCYEYAPRRVAVLDAVIPADYPDAVPMLEQALAEELSKRGFIIVPARVVADAAAAVALGPASPGALPPAEKLATLAQRLNAAYVLVPGVAIARGSEFGTLDTEIELPRDRVGERHPRNPLEDEPTLILPVTRDRLYGAVLLSVVDGVTGALVTDLAVSASQRVRFRRFSPARRSLVRNLAGQVVTAWRAPPQ
jgi:hypothetical protein